MRNAKVDLFWLVRLSQRGGLEQGMAVDREVRGGG